MGIAADGDADKVPGMKELLAARKRPVNRIALAELGTDTTDVSSLGCRRPETAPARVFDGEPAEAASHLVAALRAEGVL
jgi:electron transfer flavoprotein beta subunit